MHRLSQAILRDRLTPGQATATRKCTERILARTDPGDPDNPVNWPAWAQLMPHLLTADLAATDSPGLRQLAGSACQYLLIRGDTSTANDIASGLHQHWRERLGDNHEDTLAAATYLAMTHRAIHRYADARDLDQDTLDRRRRILTADHPETLFSAITLALDLYELGDLRSAHALARHTLDRCRQVLGADHPNTLSCAITVAGALRALGEVQAARNLDQDTLDRGRRALGADHPETLASAYNLATDLRALGEVQAARDLAHDTLRRYRRVLGTHHSYTRNAAQLVADLRVPEENADPD
jgi:hypothetical protein